VQSIDKMVTAKWVWRRFVLGLTLLVPNVMGAPVARMPLARSALGSQPAISTADLLQDVVRRAPPPLESGSGDGTTATDQPLVTGALSGSGDSGGSSGSGDSGGLSGSGDSGDSGSAVDDSTSTIPTTVTTTVGSGTGGQPTSSSSSFDSDLAIGLSVSAVVCVGVLAAITIRSLPKETRSSDFEASNELRMAPVILGASIGAQHGSLKVGQQVIVRDGHGDFITDTIGFISNV